MHVEQMSRDTRRVVCDACGWSMGYMNDLPDDEQAIEIAKQTHTVCPDPDAAADAAR